MSFGITEESLGFFEKLFDRNLSPLETCDKIRHSLEFSQNIQFPIQSIDDIITVISTNHQARIPFLNLLSENAFNTFSKVEFMEQENIIIADEKKISLKDLSLIFPKGFFPIPNKEELIFRFLELLSIHLETPDPNPSHNPFVSKSNCPPIPRGLLSHVPMSNEQGKVAF